MSNNLKNLRVIILMVNKSFKEVNLMSSWIPMTNISRGIKRQPYIKKGSLTKKKTKTSV